MRTKKEHSSYHGKGLYDRHLAQIKAENEAIEQIANEDHPVVGPAYVSCPW